MKKKIVCAFMVCALSLGCLTACGGNDSGNESQGDTITNQNDSTDADAATTLMQIGYETSGINGGSLSHIYINGMLSIKEQPGDSQGSLDLSGDSLSTGTHKVEGVPYEGDNTDGTVTMYKAASYDVKEK